MSDHPRTVQRLRRVLAGRSPRKLQVDGFRSSAVAVLLVDIGGKSHVVLTRRSPRLRAHSGQNTFPGGVCDAEDGSAEATALRETFEEIGVAADLVDVIGVMDDECTSSGYVITPIVGEMAEVPRYRPNPDEVAAVFEAPLRAFADPGRAEDLGERRIGALSYRRRLYRYGDHEVTGATARILEALCRLVAADRATPT